MEQKSIEVFINDVDIARYDGLGGPRRAVIEKFRAAGVEIPDRPWMATPDDYTSKEWDFLLRNSIYSAGVKVIFKQEDSAGRGMRWKFLY